MTTNTIREVQDNIQVEQSVEATDNRVLETCEQSQSQTQEIGIKKQLN